MESAPDAPTSAARQADITVVIATRDRPDALQRCLDALVRGAVLPAVVIVIDQSDGEATRRLIERQSALTPTPPLLYRYVRDTPRGMSAAQNLGFAQTDAAVIAVTDDDCVPDVTWLERIEATLTQDANLGGVTGRVLPLPAAGERQHPVATRTSEVRRDFRGKTPPWQVGSGNNFAVRRVWLERVHGCDERLGPGTRSGGGADMDLFYRLLRAGAQLRYAPDILVLHERQTLAGRLSRRGVYGHGTGACCGLYLRQGDLYGLRLLGNWLWFRARRLAVAGARREWRTVHEELLVLRGTLSGLLYGARLRNWQGAP
jgi:GT2 family glycosyltransferase